MKQFFTILLAVVSLMALEIELRTGEIIIGDLLCQSKGKIHIKEGSSAVSIYKRSIMRIDTTILKGKKRYMLPDSLVLSARNELTLSNNSGCAVTVKIRDSESRAVVAEAALEQGEQRVVLIPSGDFFETVRFAVPGTDSSYYTKGGVFSLNPPCEKFEKIDLEFQEHENYPFMESLKRAFEE